MKQLSKTFGQDRGSVLTLTALFIAGLVVVSGFAIDLGNKATLKEELQYATDETLFATLNALRMDFKNQTYDVSDPDDQTARNSAAKTHFTTLLNNNLQMRGLRNGLDFNVNTDMQVDVQSNGYIKVTLNLTRPLWFMKLIDFFDTTTTAEAQLNLSPPASGTARKPMVIAFVLDYSQSMDPPERMGIKTAVEDTLIGRLVPGDWVSVTTFHASYYNYDDEDFNVQTRYRNIIPQAKMKQYTDKPTEQLGATETNQAKLIEAAQFLGCPGGESSPGVCSGIQIVYGTYTQGAIHLGRAMLRYASRQIAAQGKDPLDYRRVIILGTDANSVHSSWPYRDPAGRGGQAADEAQYNSVPSMRGTTLPITGAGIKPSVRNHLPYSIDPAMPTQYNSDPEPRYLDVDLNYRYTCEGDRSGNALAALESDLARDEGYEVLSICTSSCAVTPSRSAAYYINRIMAKRIANDATLPVGHQSQLNGFRTSIGPLDPPRFWGVGAYAADPLNHYEEWFDALTYNINGRGEISLNTFGWPWYRDMNLYGTPVWSWDNPNIANGDPIRLVAGSNNGEQCHPRTSQNPANMYRWHGGSSTNNNYYCGFYRNELWWGDPCDPSVNLENGAAFRLAKCQQKNAQGKRLKPGWCVNTNPDNPSAGDPITRYWDSGPDADFENMPQLVEEALNTVLEGEALYLSGTLGQYE